MNACIHEFTAPLDAQVSACQGLIQVRMQGQVYRYGEGQLSLDAQVSNLAAQWYFRIPEAGTKTQVDGQIQNKTLGGVRAFVMAVF